jgi:hypothetical protein
MVVPNWVEKFTRNLFFLGPERVSKFKRILILVLIGVFFFLVIHFMAVAFGREDQKAVLIDIAFGLIPEFIGAVAVYWVLDSSIKQLYGISELPDLPLETFIGELRSTRRISILETFTKLATDLPLHEKFSSCIKDALRQGAEVRILLIHPDSEGAQQRAEELAKVDIDVREQIEISLAQFYKLQGEIYLDTRIDNRRKNFQVRLYHASPSIAMHMWDRDAYLSFFPVRQRSDEAPNLKISMATTFGHYAAAKFDELWEHSETIALSSHMEIQVFLSSSSREKEMLYCLRASKNHTRLDTDDQENLPSFYVTNHFSASLMDILDAAHGNYPKADVRLIAEGNEYRAKCEKLTSSPETRQEIIAGYGLKYAWNAEETEKMIREDPVIYKVELVEEINVS